MVEVNISQLYLGLRSQIHHAGTPQQRDTLTGILMDASVPGLPKGTHPQFVQPRDAKDLAWLPKNLPAFV